jgi:hypothetical protein
VLGVYFLLGPSEDDPDRFRAYVGEVGKRDLLTRLKEHAKAKEWWNRALLIASASDAFNSDEIGWLEGRLYDVLNNAVAADVMNRGRPGDDSLPMREQAVLERYIEPITSALRACGAPPDTVDQRSGAVSRRRPPRKRYSETIVDLVNAGLLKPGTRLRPTRAKLEGRAIVCESGDLEVDGKHYSSPSSAAQALSGNQSEPGWDFWGAPSGDGSFAPLAELRQKLRKSNSGGVLAHHPANPARTPQRVAPIADAHDRERQPPASVARSGKKRFFNVTLQQLVDAKMLKEGQSFVPTRKTAKGKDLSQVVAVLNHQAELVVDGRGFATPSGAARYLVGGAVAGWGFWATEDGERLEDIRDQYLGRSDASQ